MFPHALLPALPNRLALIQVAASRGACQAAHQAVFELAARLSLAGPLRVVDAGGLFDLYSLARVRTVGVPAAAFFLLAYLASVVLGPLLLPWLPGRAFALKGAVLGALVVVGAGGLASSLAWTVGAWHAAAWALLVPALASFTLLSFTGATPFTSLSGVLKEMRIAMPLQGAAALAGLALWLVGLFAGRGS